MIKKSGRICLALILGFVLLPRLTLAQEPAFLESRIARLETENFQLRSQISRLESQLSELRRRSPSQTPTPDRPAPQVPPRQTRQRQVSSSDPMFDRLANLVIELKEPVQALETQVAQLKKQRR